MSVVSSSNLTFTPSFAKSLYLFKRNFMQFNNSWLLGWGQKAWRKDNFKKISTKLMEVKSSLLWIMPVKVTLYYNMFVWNILGFIL